MKSDRILVHTVSPIRRRQFNLAVARALDLQEDGHEVSVTYCDQKAGTCSANLVGNPVTCFFCRRSARRSIEDIGLQAIPVPSEPESVVEENPPSSAVCRALVTAVNSNLITQLRLLPVDLKKFFFVRHIKRRYFSTAISLYRSYTKLIQKIQPDRIELINGRHACSRFALLVANEHEVGYNVLEYTFRKLPIIFTGHIPHDRIAFQERVKSLPADEAVGEKYYSNRKSSAYNRFAKAHQSFDPEAMPDDCQYKVSFFLSSQDECASLGPEWRSSFPEDVAVIGEACRRFPEYFFCVRFHPHQAQMPGDVQSPFQTLGHFKNLKIYPPDSLVNTYDLVEWSDRIVTFGSTISIEACWMGKVAIQLGPSFYDNLNISYTPDSMEAFLDLLARRDLQPGDRTNAARFAYFSLFEHDEIRHLEIQGRRNRVRGMTRNRRIGNAISKQVNNMTCNVIKRAYRLVG